MSDSEAGPLHDRDQGQDKAADEPCLKLKPVIHEIVRTRYFGNPLKLLVDKIHVVPFRSHEEEAEAYRVWLSDTEYNVQAVLRPELHPFITAGQILEGSLVLVTKYRLEKFRKVSRDGGVWCLVIDNMEPVGADGREQEPFFFEETRFEAINASKIATALDAGGLILPALEAASNAEKEAVIEEQAGLLPEDIMDDSEDSLDSLILDEIVPGRKRSSEELSPSPTPQPKVRKLEQTTISTDITPKRVPPIPQTISPDRRSLFSRRESPIKISARPPSRAQQPKIASDNPLKHQASLLLDPETPERLPAPSSAQPIATEREDRPLSRARPATSAGPPTPLRPISRSLTLTTLDKLTGPPQKLHRNQVVDVLAVVVSVSPETTYRPHYRQLPRARDIRIMDPSVDKKVQLSVFVDAGKFTPEVGTVALFRSVTTHEWDGGSLKAYPRDCGGRKWFFPWPWDLEGCDVAGLKAWWEGISQRGEI